MITSFLTDYKTIIEGKRQLPNSLNCTLPHADVFTVFICPCIINQNRRSTHDFFV